MPRDPLPSSINLLPTVGMVKFERDRIDGSTPLLFLLSFSRASGERWGGRPEQRPGRHRFRPRSGERQSFLSLFSLSRWASAECSFQLQARPISSCAETLTMRCSSNASCHEPTALRLLSLLLLLRFCSHLSEMSLCSSQPSGPGVCSSCPGTITTSRADLVSCHEQSEMVSLSLPSPSPNPNIGPPLPR